MTGRERFLCALSNEKPDRLPCQVHSWMDYYLKTYLDGCDQFEAYKRFNMDPVAYADPIPVYADADLANWDVKTTDLGYDDDGNHREAFEVTTPAGTLTWQKASNKFTWWMTQHPIRSEEHFDIWDQYVPVPTGFDWSPVREAKKKIGETGIVRGAFFDYGQGSPWQSFCFIHDVEPSIMAAFDKPDWLAHVMERMLQKKLRAIEVAGKIEMDLVETGGGAGSNTVISPDMHATYCLPYDKRQHDALHAAGTKVVYHLCGGLMKMLDHVAANDADALETMTPPDMGGDCDLAEATRLVGDKLAFIGGFSQNIGFEKGTPEDARRMVRELHAACPDGGYICSPSDHFFFGDVENIQAFADECRKCSY